MKNLFFQRGMGGGEGGIITTHPSEDNGLKTDDIAICSALWGLVVSSHILEAKIVTSLFSEFGIYFPVRSTTDIHLVAKFALKWGK